jgi:DNA-binding protein H-NS
MAFNLETLSPKDLAALIENAQSQMHTARAGQVQDVKKKIDTLLNNSGLTLADVYPSLGGKQGKHGKKSVVAPKYRNPANATQTWSGRGKRPLWFVAALRRRGVTADHLLIDQTAAAAEAPVKVARAAKPAKAARATKKVARKATSKKTAAKKAAKR